MQLKIYLKNKTIKTKNNKLIDDFMRIDMFVEAALNKRESNFPRLKLFVLIICLLVFQKK